MVSKIRGKTVIAFLPANGGWPRGGPRNWGIGARTRASSGPSERPRGDVEPGGLLSASRACPHYASPQAKSQTAASRSLTISIPYWHSDRSSVSLFLSLTHTRARTHTHTHTLTQSLLLLLFLLEGSHAMMDNSTLYSRIQRLRTNACDHGSGPVEAARSQSRVRMRESHPFLPEGLHGQLIMFIGSRSRCQSYTNTSLTG
jgi:hypothetical protein